MIHLHVKKYINYFLRVEKLLETHCLHLLQVLVRAIHLLRVELMTREGFSLWAPTPHMEPMQTITEHQSPRTLITADFT